MILKYFYCFCYVIAIIYNLSFILYVSSDDILGQFNSCVILKEHFNSLVNGEWLHSDVSIIKILLILYIIVMKCFYTYIIANGLRYAYNSQENP